MAIKREDIELRIKLLSDTKDLKNGIQEVQNTISQMAKGGAISPKEFSRLSNIIGEIAQKYQKYVNLQNQPNKTNANLKQMENLMAGINKELSDISQEFSNLDFSN